jgi:hypothetical protein
MTTTTTNLEARAIGREMAKDRRDMTNYLKDEYQLNEEEARAKTLELARMQTTAQLMERPLRDLSWNDLNQIADEDATLAIETWDRIKTEVQEDCRNGVRAGRALEANGSTPKEMAEFQVARNEFAEQHRPRNGIERTLVDMLAQSHASYSFWLERLTAYTHLEPKTQAVKDEGRWSPPRVEHSKAVDEAAGLVDRFHRMFTRTLRALRDQRRYAPTLIVQHAQQVNLAQQQCNVIGDQADLLPS